MDNKQTPIGRTGRNQQRLQTVSTAQQEKYNRNPRIRNMRNKTKCNRMLRNLPREVQNSPRGNRLLPHNLKWRKTRLLRSKSHFSIDGFKGITGRLGLAFLFFIFVELSCNRYYFKALSVLTLSLVSGKGLVLRYILLSIIIY